MQLLSDLGTHLSGITVDGLTASQDDVVLLNAVGIDGGGDDLGGSVGIGTAELTGGDQNTLGPRPWPSAHAAYPLREEDPW